MAAVGQSLLSDIRYIFKSIFICILYVCLILERKLIKSQPFSPDDYTTTEAIAYITVPKFVRPVSNETIDEKVELLTPKGFKITLKEARNITSFQVYVQINENFTEISPFRTDKHNIIINNMEGNDLLKYVNDWTELADNDTVFYWLNVYDKFGGRVRKLNQFFHVTNQTDGILRIDYNSSTLNT